jgi:hypothetical protein
MLMAKKTVKFTQDAIEKLPKNLPVVYTISSETEVLYVGTAKRGRVRERLNEHLSTGPDPIQGGSKVQIEQMQSIGDAEKKATRLIAERKPPQNKQGR